MLDLRGTWNSFWKLASFSLDGRQICSMDIELVSGPGPSGDKEEERHKRGGAAD